MTNLRKALNTSILMVVFAPAIMAQGQVQTSFDVVSTYVWRGVAFSGVSIQPSFEYATSKASIGIWGSQGIDGFQEMDPYASFSFTDEFSLIVTDYYLPGTPYFSIESHAVEAGIQFQHSKWSFSGYYIFAGESSVGDDLYFESSYSTNELTFFLGVGNGWHTSDSEFNLVNIGITKFDELKINDTFSISISSSVIFNPDSEQLFVLVGLGF